jgi:hypothetical protein
MSLGWEISEFEKVTGDEDVSLALLVSTKGAA